MRTSCLNSILIAAILSTGVSAEPENPGSHSEALITDANAKYWTDKNNTIPVCWETPGYDREKKISRRAVMETWQFWANVNFTGWGTCPSSGDSEQVRIRISPQAADVNAGAGGLATMGTAALSKAADNAPGVRLSFAPNTADEGRVEYIAVHELGHVLGFGHEQDASDNEGPGHCTDGLDKNAIPISITAYDRDSIMNYCNRDGNMTGHLTFADIHGAQSVYGVRRSTTATTGMLLAGHFRSTRDLLTMSPDDRRNTLIVELSGRTRDSVAYYQSLNDSDLSGAGALLVYLRSTGSRSDEALKTMTADDMRNTVIVEVAAQTGRGQDLQALPNLELVQQVIRPNYYIKGVLLYGKFRTLNDFVFMSAEDQRNTLITELSNRTLDTTAYYQSLDNNELAGVGALLVYLRETGSRSDDDLKTMTADDMRNTVITEVGALTGRGLDLQALSNLELLYLVMLGRG